MDIDKLTKLVKLANHNPNDNEANAAARKVCSMIEKENFNFNNTYQQQTKQQPFVGWDGFVRAYQQNTPQYNKRSQYDSQYDASKDTYERMKREAERMRRERDEQREREEELYQRRQEEFNKRYHVDWQKKTKDIF
jgi:hypothetical protein